MQALCRLCLYNRDNSGRNKAATSGAGLVNANVSLLPKIRLQIDEHTQGSLLGHSGYVCLSGDVPDNCLPG